MVSDRNQVRSKGPRLSGRGEKMSAGGLSGLMS
jgi:hypothetical protein